MHTIKKYSCEWAVNHEKLDSTGIIRRAGLDPDTIDWNALHDKIAQHEVSDDVTEEDRKTWCPTVLDPTQKLLHDYIVHTWFPQVVVDRIAVRPLSRLMLKEFGTAGSGKTRLNRTIVVSLRSITAILRDLKAPEPPVHLTWDWLRHTLQDKGLKQIADAIHAESAFNSSLPKNIFQGLKEFGQRSKIRLTAYTGVASTLLGFGARTICSLFKTGTRKFKPVLDGPAAIALQSEAGLGECIMCVVDEVSFLGRPLLGKLDVRAREGRAEWMRKANITELQEAGNFGNIGMVLAGDTSQLAPVNDKELISDSKADGKLDRAGRELWQEVPHVIQLWRCHRQKADAEYAQECLHLRSGTFDQRHWASWLQRDLTRGSMTEEERLSFETGVSLELVGTNAHCGEINGRRAVQRICQEWGEHEDPAARGIYRFRAEGTAEAKHMNAQKFSGLRSITHVVVGAEQMLTANINPTVGLSNGAIGTCVAVVPGTHIGTLPICVIVNFPKYTGPALFHVDGDDAGNAQRRLWVPILPQTRNHEDKAWISRTQVPLRLCYAITINKSQGLSLERPTVVNLNPTSRTSRYKPMMALSRDHQ